MDTPIKWENFEYKANEFCIVDGDGINVKFLSKPVEKDNNFNRKCFEVEVYNVEEKATQKMQMSMRLAGAVKEALGTDMVNKSAFIVRDGEGFKTNYIVTESTVEEEMVGA